MFKEKGTQPQQPFQNREADKSYSNFYPDTEVFLEFAQA